MESGVIAVDRNNNECDYAPPLRTIIDIEEANGAMTACTVVDFSDTKKPSVCDLTTATTDRIASACKTRPMEPQEQKRSLPNGEDSFVCGFSVAMEANGNNVIDHSNSTPFVNPDEYTKSSVNTNLDAVDEPEPEPVSADGKNKTERRSNIASEREQKVDTSFEIDTSSAIPDCTRTTGPTESTTDPTPISIVTSSDYSEGANGVRLKKVKSFHSQSREYGFLSTNDHVKFETKAGDQLPCHQNVSRSTNYDQQCSSKLTVLSLPIDSLHSIASFLVPVELKNFGQCNKSTIRICREVFKRVRMHGFRCASEVVTAWKFGQRADAKELCALYVSAGVPIYPHSLGHSYHTLVWRLSIEAKHLQEQQHGNTNNMPASDSDSRASHKTEWNEPTSTNVSSFDPSERVSSLVDPFYNDRDDFRLTEDLINVLGETDLTYLEEKSLYTLNAKCSQSQKGLRTRPNWRWTSIDQAHRRARNPLTEGLSRPQQPNQASRMAHRPPLVEAVGAHSVRNRLIPMAEIGRGIIHRHTSTRSNSFSGNHCSTPNVSLKIHRHLFDQHLLGRSGVDDSEGTMTTPSLRLSADFFHPFFSFRSSKETIRHRKAGAQISESIDATINSLMPAYHQRPSANMQQIDNHSTLENNGELSAQPQSESGISNLADDSDSDLEREIIFPRPLLMEPSGLNVDESMSAGATLQSPSDVSHSYTLAPVDPIRRLESSSIINVPETNIVPDEVSSHNDILSNIDLDVYSASSRSLKSDTNDTMERLNNYLSARFIVYHRRLERHLMNNNGDFVEETIMDFWDEFLPQTAGIQYHDKHTAVPRISCLESFLTKPCPKQIGIIQCEIERVKLSSKKKGVNMKGRFFPTYEYRLFIRHRPSDPAYDFVESTSGHNNSRRDTLLMLAKNKDRKFSDSTGAAAKKGANNYYLSLPHQDDLKLHFEHVNGLDDSLESYRNGIGTQSSSSQYACLLGRLQSNFVGTEFQIFTPRSTVTDMSAQIFPTIPRTICPGIVPDDSILSDNIRKREANSISPARSRSRFGRLSLKGLNGNNSEISKEFFEPLQLKPPCLNLRRSRSSDVTPGRNRKVSAAESYFEPQRIKIETQHAFFEEDGAITYTANLLGSRPRIMDVCIPKVSPHGKEIGQRRYLDSYRYQDAGSPRDLLLNHLKRLQQNSQIEENGILVDPANNGAEIFRIDEQGYSALNDNGLLALQNRPPWWNVELGSFVLNFGGRVSVASVKNFQLCDRNDQNHIMLQFGRIEGRHSFTMDFQYPLTAVQAFAIAISSLQSKISFG